MSMSISIHPVSTSLEMYGEPDANSAYSLSGVVTISVSSPYSLFERRRTAKLLLQSLSLTFEGQSEIFTHASGYTGLRLCSVTKELVASSEGIEFTNEGHEDDNEPCQWDVLFNLPIPGWLPASTTMGMDEIGISYGLYATAKFINLDIEHGPSPWSFATFCTPFRSRVRSTYASKAISLRRYVLPPHVDQSTSPINYLVNSHLSAEKPDSSKKRIPTEVLSKIQVLASIPEFVDVKGSSIPITVRLRTKGLESNECKRLQVTEIGINIIQQERCRYRPSSSILSRYPLPPREQQPPNMPLRNPHPISSIFDLGLCLGREHSESVCRTFSLLPEKESGKYKLQNENYAFANDADHAENPTWYTMETSIPYAQMSPAPLDPDTEDWAGPETIRPSSSSPLFSVTHDVAISLTFSYDLPNSDERARERLNFNISLSFGCYLPSSPPVTSIPKPTDPTPESSTQPTPSPPPFSNLPSYSQLYDHNGDRKIDFSVPLPRYTPKEVSQPTPDSSTMESSISTCTPEKSSADFLDDVDEAVPLLSSSS
ncbi:hypothetical protein FA13DRAFT_1019838 [Coprinellus micaceus]|uniref:Arrestin-like N-terminal domain-containing protein n=1 Tax=Coprinellus micaceus TaxID=71717 RepID=A0A4Y7SXH1_COPMI|nr:hypothetical protein FA13DRAFT_1019838 [Coprinellus micaceus]